jgi:homogentisate 1,2-dioxygenase
MTPHGPDTDTYTKVYLSVI